MQILHPNTLFHCSKNYYRTKIIKYSPQYFIFCAGSCYYSQQIYLCSLFAFKVLMCLIISPEFLLFLQKRVPENNNAGQRTGKAAVKPGNTLKLDHQVSYSRKETKNRKPKKKKDISSHVEIILRKQLCLCWDRGALPCHPRQQKAAV